MLNSHASDPQKADPRSLKTYRFQMTPLRAAGTQLAKWLFPLFARLESEISKSLPAAGPVILAANHVTNFDVFPIQFSLNRLIFFMGKAELFKNPVLDWAFRQFGGFPVNRGERDDWALDHAAQVLDHGLVLGMFPEGKRNKGLGLHPGKTGVARLAIQKGCSILPVAQDGTQKMFKDFPRRPVVHVRFGQLIQPRPGETALSLTDRVMFAIAEMLPLEERGVYRLRPSGF